MTTRVIGIIAPPWPVPPRAYGGVELALDGLCRGLVERGHEVRLWSALSSTCPVPRSGIPVDVDPAKGWHSAPIELWHVLAGYEWMNQQGVELIHDVTYAGPLLGRTLTDIPIVTTNYLPFTPPLSGHSSPDLGVIYRSIASRDVPILALSHEQASGAVGFETRTIYLGTDVRNTPMGTGEGDPAGPYAAFLGRMAPEKGVREAILAAKATGLRLKIAARLSEDHEFAYYDKQVAPLVDGDEIQFLGELDHAAKLDVLKGAVAMVNPIAWPEPFGLVMIESLATGTPVIACRGGAVAEIVEHGVTGAVCDSFDEVVAGLERYKEYDRQACRASAVKRFSNERMVNDHLEFYESVLAKR